MNAANVMAISPKAGAVNKVQLTRTVGKLGKASANMTSDSFDEAMGKAGEEVSGFEILQDGLYQVTYQNGVSVIFNEQSHCIKYCLYIKILKISCDRNYPCFRTEIA